MSYINNNNKNEHKDIYKQVTFETEHTDVTVLLCINVPCCFSPLFRQHDVNTDDMSCHYVVIDAVVSQCYHLHYSSYNLKTIKINVSWKKTCKAPLSFFVSFCVLISDTKDSLNMLNEHFLTEGFTVSSYPGFKKSVSVAFLQQKPLCKFVCNHGNNEALERLYYYEPAIVDCCCYKKNNRFDWSGFNRFGILYF